MEILDEGPHPFSRGVITKYKVPRVNWEGGGNNIFNRPFGQFQSHDTIISSWVKGILSLVC